MSKGAGLTSHIGSTEGLGRIFDQHHTVLVTQGSDLIDFCRCAVQVSHHDRLDLAAILLQCQLQRGRIHVPSIPLAVDKHLHATLVRRGVDRGRKGHIGTQHNVPLLHSGQLDRQMECRGTGIQCRRVTDAYIACDFFFKTIYIEPQRCDPVFIKRLLNKLHFLSMHGRSGKPNPLVFHGVSPL